MTQTTHTSVYDCIEPDDKRVVSDSVRTPTFRERVAVGLRRQRQMLRRWQSNKAAWSHVSKLPERLLRDVGLTRNEARAQLDRPLLRYWIDDDRR